MILLEKIKRKQTKFMIGIDKEMKFGDSIELTEPAGFIAISDITSFIPEYNILFISKEVVGNGNKEEVSCLRKDVESLLNLVKRANERL